LNGLIPTGLLGKFKRTLLRRLRVRKSLRPRSNGVFSSSVSEDFLPKFFIVDPITARPDSNLAPTERTSVRVRNSP
jgi:hypothetical protein